MLNQKTQTPKPYNWVVIFEDRSHTGKLTVYDFNKMQQICDGYNDYLIVQRCKRTFNDSRTTIEIEFSSTRESYERWKDGIEHFESYSSLKVLKFYPVEKISCMKRFIIGVGMITMVYPLIMGFKFISRIISDRVQAHYPY